MIFRLLLLLLLNVILFNILLHNTRAKILKEGIYVALQACN